MHIPVCISPSVRLISDKIFYMIDDWNNYFATSLKPGARALVSPTTCGIRHFQRRATTFLVITGIIVPVWITAQSMTAPGILCYSKAAEASINDTKTEI